MEPEQDVLEWENNKRDISTDLCKLGLFKAL